MVKLFLKNLIMYFPLLKNSKLHLKQVLIFSTCFFISSNLVYSQNNWKKIDSIHLDVGYVEKIISDSVNNQIVLGTVNIRTLNGLSTCAVFTWNPENGARVLLPYDPIVMSTDNIESLRMINDSIFAIGARAITIWKNNNLVLNLFDNQSHFQDILAYKDHFLVTNGYSITVNGKRTGALMEWDGDTTFSEFENITQSMDPSGGVFEVIKYKNEIYVGGNDIGLNGSVMNKVMRWNGTQWRDLDGGILPLGNWGGINDMIVYKGDLYMGGLFIQDNHTKEHNIARWDGNKWKTVGGGVGNLSVGIESIEEMYVADGYLYVVGKFATAGGVPAQNIARWDGYEWCGCGPTLDSYTLTSITKFRDTLYIAGIFNYVDVDKRTHLAKFVGTNFADTCGSTAVGIKTIAPQKESITGYPNPTSHTLNFDLPNRNPQKIEIIVLNTLSQVVLKKQVYAINGQVQIDTSTLKNGAYFGEIISEKSNYVFSFIKN